MDYKVNYENHCKFSANHSRKRKEGSPVRIFTNIPPNLFVLEESEGYKYCSICERYVASENKHCIHCNRCTSKDGRESIHCFECNRCVKNTWKHCNRCKKCSLPHIH
ncbi:zinc finger CCHC domain containing 4-like isoform CRA_b [Leptotrombidium deliense]|uniref:Zinc finger CCHC domain containing 4-like isoform CRA_b n=1 Tax=Leptotrombidium deliense TaxID=299467 RepID=A0A443SQI5_9ACAR|nr:zinc finger CCHC domain containing 4-like isoform CRA_b [Leptotrombidium deliense]